MAYNARKAYDSYGKLTASTGSLVNPFRYTARESDTETGLYYYRARYYDQASGRFLREDPIGFNAGANFYSYVGNNPAGNTDLFGLSPDDVQRMLNLAQRVLDQMTQDGLRIDRANLNNFLSTLQRKGLWPKSLFPKTGKPYLGCGEQADRILSAVQFPTKPYEDKTWKFGILDLKSGWLPIFPHQVGVAYNDNPDDPDIIFDPWNNRFFAVPKVKASRYEMTAKF